MPFSEAQITRAIEQGLCRTSTLDTSRVVGITCEDVYFYGLSANTFARCGVRIVADDKEQLVELVVKRWVPGGTTDIDMGIAPLPRLKKLSWLVPDSARLSRGEAVARYVEGVSLSKSELAKIGRVGDWIQGARIRPARESFYKTLSDSDGAMWKRHECDRSALIAAFAEFPTTLVHGDFYPLNIGLRVVDGEETVILIDWEWMGNGCGALDVAKLLSVGAASEHADFDSQGLATYYFDRYVAHGGTLFDLATWKRAYELAEVYHALIVHTLATGWSILDGSVSRTCLEAKTPRLTELIAKYLG